MISVKTKTIDGAKYDVTQMTARQALKMQAKLIKILGPCIAEFISAIGKMEDAGISRAIMALAANVDENTFDKLVFELMLGIRKDGVELSEANINLEFAGSLNTLYKVLAFVLEANYGDFLEEGGIIKSLIAVAKPAVPAFQSQDSTKDSKKS